MAETTTATCGPASTSAFTSRATRRMRSRSATDVPPNFITSRDMRRGARALLLRSRRAEPSSGAEAAPQRPAASPWRCGALTGAHDVASHARSSIDPAEVERFSRIAAEWWDPKGKFAPLHKFNPVRLGFIRDQALRRFGRDAQGAPAVRGPAPARHRLRRRPAVASPWRRLGFEVTGVDASERNIGTASAHAAEQGLADRLPLLAPPRPCWPQGEPPFDVILNMEVIEHVADPGEFLRDCARLLTPGGLMIVATLNRTLKAFALAKVGAEYVLRWLPAGTHDWTKFLKPEELRGFLAGEPVVGRRARSASSSIRSTGRWSQCHDADVNYMMTVAREARLGSAPSRSRAARWVASQIAIARAGAAGLASQQPTIRRGARCRG